MTQLSVEITQKIDIPSYAQRLASHFGTHARWSVDPVKFYSGAVLLLLNGKAGTVLLTSAEVKAGLYWMGKVSVENGLDEESVEEINRVATLMAEASRK